MVKRKEEEEEERQQQQQQKKSRVKKKVFGWFGWFLCVTTPTDSRQSECQRFEKKARYAVPAYL